MECTRAVGLADTVASTVASTGAPLCALADVEPALNEVDVEEEGEVAGSKDSLGAMEDISGSVDDKMLRLMHGVERLSVEGSHGNGG